jgi:holin-like protein
MKFMKEFVIILVITFLGECAKAIIRLPIPASIYGLIFMLIALATRMIKVEDVKRAGGFLIEIMPMMFIPAAVGIIAAWDELKPICGQIVLIIVVSTILVMVVSGRVTQKVIELSGRKKK